MARDPFRPARAAAACLLLAPLLMAGCVDEQPPGVLLLEERFSFSREDAALEGFFGTACEEVEVSRDPPAVRLRSPHAREEMVPRFVVVRDYGDSWRAAVAQGKDAAPGVVGLFSATGREGAFERAVEAAAAPILGDADGSGGWTIGGPFETRGVLVELRWSGEGVAFGDAPLAPGESLTRTFEYDVPAKDGGEPVRVTHVVKATHLGRVPVALEAAECGGAPT